MYHAYTPTQLWASCSTASSIVLKIDWLVSSKGAFFLYDRHVQTVCSTSISYIWLSCIQRYGCYVNRKTPTIIIDFIHRASSCFSFNKTPVLRSIRQCSAERTYDHCRLCMLCRLTKYLFYTTGAHFAGLRVLV